MRGILLLVIISTFILVYDSYASHEKKYSEIIDCGSECLSELNIQQLIVKIKKMEATNDRQKSALKSLLSEDEGDFRIISKGNISSVIERLTFKTKYVVLVYEGFSRSYRVIVNETYKNTYVSEVIITNR